MIKRIFLHLLLGAMLLLLSLGPSAAAQEDVPQTSEAALAWTRMAIHGFGTSSNDTVWSMANYNGKLYAGTRNPTLGAQLWSTTNGANWRLEKSGGLGDAHNTAIASMATNGFDLLLGTENGQDGAEAWKTDGVAWSQINPDGFGNPNNDIVWSITPDGFDFYFGTLNAVDGANVWKYDANRNWLPLSANGLGSSSNIILTSMVSYPFLQAGTWNQNGGGQVQAYDSNLATWDLTAPPGFGDSWNYGIRSMLYFNNAVYAGTFNSHSGAQVWRQTFESGRSWNRLADHGFGDPNNKGISSLFAFGRYLYAGTENTVTGAEIWRSLDGLNWEQVNIDGFGSPNNSEAAAMAGFGPYLFVGTRNPAAGAEVWRLTLFNDAHSFTINSQTRSSRQPDVAYNSRDREYLAAWTNQNPGVSDDDLQVRRIAWGGRPVGLPTNISNSPGYSRSYPALAYDGSHNRYLVTWVASYTNGRYRLFARLLSGSGAPLADEFEIPTSDYLGYSPRVAYWPEAGAYLVMYNTWKIVGANSVTNTFIQIVTPSGTLSSGPLGVRQNAPGSAGGLDLAYNPERGELLLVWEEGDWGSEDIYGALMVNPSGPRADTPFLISSNTGSFYDYAPSVAALSYPSGTGEYLVAWAHRSYDRWTSEIQVRRVSGDAIPQGASLTVSDMATQGFAFARVIRLTQYPSFWVVWSEEYSSYGGALFTRLVDGDGNPLGSPFYLAGSNASGSPGLAAGPGNSFLAVYKEEAMGSPYSQVRGLSFGVTSVYLPLIRRGK